MLKYLVSDCNTSEGDIFQPYESLNKKDRYLKKSLKSDLNGVKSYS